jgi:hypothetical protein
MSFVSEDLIDQTIDLLETTPETFEHLMEKMEEEQPVLLAYFFSEQFELFTESERAYLQYLTLVIWHSCRKVFGQSPLITEEQISAAEDTNWEQLELVKAHAFRDRIGIFFEDTDQEDLLAFIEDALLDDEEDAIVTKEGREAMFITLKSVVDMLTPARKQ